jgi:cutinase
MKFSTAMATLLAGTVAAMPTAIERRQFGFGGLGGTGSTANELSSGCKKITFIFARGSTEIGNMVSRDNSNPQTWHPKLTSHPQGSTVGPPTCDGLKKAYSNDVACQGVGGAYTASVGSNALPGGTTPAAYNEAIGIFEKAASQCPDTIIVAAGYSQGAAVMVNAVSKLDASVQNRVAGVVLYGNTRNRQENGKIPNFPPEKAKTYCNASDGVCGGALLVTAGHLTYTRDVSSAVQYLQGQISAQGSSTSSGSSTGTSTGGSTSTSSSSGLGGFGGFGGIFGNWASWSVLLGWLVPRAWWMVLIEWWIHGWMSACYWCLDVLVAFSCHCWVVVSIF